MSNCRIPCCENELGDNGELCDPCLNASVIRFMQFEGSWKSGNDTSMYLEDRKEYWEKRIIRDIDKLVKLEKKTIDKYGIDYDREDRNPKEIIRN